MRDIANKNIGDFLSAETFNANFISELLEVVTSAGFTLDPELGPDTDLSMLVKSLVIYSVASSYFAESGAANNYILTRSGGLEPLPSYVDGMTVIFKPTNDNSGASVINVDSIGSKDLVASDGSALTSGEIITDKYVIARYRGGTDDFEVVNSSAPGDAATLEGHPASYFAVDSEVVHLAGAETVTGTKTFAAGPTLNNNIGLLAKQLAGTVRPIIAIDASDICYVGNNNIATNIRSNGTLTHNGNDILTAADIVEGTFTPVAEGLTTAGTGTYSSQTGTYQKIGNWVHFSIYLIVTAHTGTGDLIITGLPYNVGHNAAISVFPSNLTYTGDFVFGRPTAGTDTIYLYTTTSGAASTRIAMDTAFTLIISGSYEVA